MSKHIERKFSLKDHLFNKKSVTLFASYIEGAYPAFNKTKYIKRVLSGFPERELKERIVFMREQLKEYIPYGYKKTLAILLKALPPELDPTKTDNDFGDFILAPFGDYVAAYGCEEEYLDVSLPALREMTKRFSVEDPIRYFINAFPEETLMYLQTWTTDENYHVRRLVSEGMRPKLPWSQKISYTSKETLPLLNQLYADPTRYVVRSVANHLNDISKHDPELVIETLRQWNSETKQNLPREMEYLTNHALRTLVKQGNAKALELLGYPSSPKITVSSFKILTPSLVLGEKLSFHITLTSHREQNLMIDYCIHFPGSTNSIRTKVFKIKKGSYRKGQEVVLEKQHLIKAMTTRRLYPGTHHVELQINGMSFGSLPFELIFA